MENEEFVRIGDCRKSAGVVTKDVGKNVRLGCSHLHLRLTACLFSVALYHWV